MPGKWRIAATLLLAFLVLLTGPAGVTRAAQLIHEVQPDETLESIARRYGIEPSTLAERNNLARPYALQAGQRLLVAGSPGSSLAPSVAAIPPQPAPAVPVPARLALLPTPGQTLQFVAWRYGSGSNLVRWANPLASLAPRSGAVLVVPVRAPGALAPARQSCTAWPAAGEALVARVNSWGIGLSAFERRWNEVVGGLQHAGVNVWNADFRAIEPQARRSVVNEMIDQVLVQQWAAGTGTTVSAAELDAWLQARVQAAGGAETFSTWLEETRQTWEGFQQKGCYEVLREALQARLARGASDPERKAAALARWLSLRRASSSIEIYATVAGADGIGLLAARASGPPSVSQGP